MPANYYYYYLNSYDIIMCLWLCLWTCSRVDFSLLWGVLTPAAVSRYSLAGALYTKESLFWPSASALAVRAQQVAEFHWARLKHSAAYKGRCSSAAVHDVSLRVVPEHLKYLWDGSPLASVYLSPPLLSPYMLIKNRPNTKELQQGVSMATVPQPPWVGVSIFFYLDLCN